MEGFTISYVPQTQWLKGSGSQLSTVSPLSPLWFTDAACSLGTQYVVFVFVLFRFSKQIMEQMES